MNKELANEINKHLCSNCEFLSECSDSIFNLKMDIAKIASIDVLLKVHPEKNQRDAVYKKMINYIKDHNNSFYDRYCVLCELVELKFRNKEIADIVVEMLNEVPDNYSNEYHVWELFDLLYVLGWKTNKNDYIYFADSAKFRDQDKQMLFLLFGKLKDDDYIELMLKNLDNYAINGHIISALSKYKDVKFDKYFKNFVNDERLWVKKIAKQRLNVENKS